MADRAAENIAPSAETEAPPLSVADLRAMIRKHALKGPKGKSTRLRMPSDDALTKLAANVNQLADFMREAAVVAEGWNEDCREVAKALDALRPPLSRLIARLQSDAQIEAKRNAARPAGEPAPRRVFLSSPEVLHQARAVAEAVQSFVPPSLWWQAPAVKAVQTPDWRHLAWPLFQDIKCTFGCVPDPGRGTRLGLYAESGAVRLLAVLLEHVTARPIRASRVAQNLRAVADWIKNQK